VAVRRKSRPFLETDDGCLDPRPEHTVERAGREAVPCELELQGGNVPAEGSTVQYPAADPVTAEPSERSPGLRAGDAVGLEARAALEAPDRRPRLGPGHAVDRSPVDPFRAQRRLERRDRRASLTPGRPCEEKGDHGGCDPDRHACLFDGTTA
jgi:hypothetical protein